MSLHQLRVDLNQREIVSALRAVGAVVVLLNKVGIGCPDLLVGFRDMTYLFEVKRPGQEKRRTRTAERQEAFRALWVGGPIMVVRSVEEALGALGITHGKRPEAKSP